MKYFIIFLVLLIPFQNAFALYDIDYKRSNGLDFKPLTGARDNIFQDSKVDWCIHTTNSTYAQIAKISINEWEERLTETTKKVVWNMDTHTNNLDEKICDGHIWFKEIPQKIDDKLQGIAGLSQKHTPLPDVVIYTKDYQKTLIQIFKNHTDELTDEVIEEEINKINHQNHSDKDIERITKHELGHALSLFHPSDVWNEKGIMSYNLDEFEILDEEVWQVVHTYPNGFNGIQKNQFGVKIDQSNNLHHVITTGEWINLTIEVPIKNNLRVIDADFRVNSGNGDETRFYFGSIEEIPDNDHFAEIMTLKAHFVKNKMQFHVGVIPLHEDILSFKIILKDVTGQELQYDLKNVIKIQDAIFSKKLVENRQQLKIFSLSDSRVNEHIENEKADFEKTKKTYYEELKKCLKTKNGKYCKEIHGNSAIESHGKIRLYQ